MIHSVKHWLIATAALLFCVVSQAALPDFKPLIKDNADAIVNISASQTQEAVSQNQQQVPDIFKRFFGDQIPFEFPQAQPSESLGSGFIISNDGYILSNHHVIDGADEIIVRLNDRRELKAELIGSDPETDVALLKVDAKRLPYVQLGKSAKLEVGEWVVAIGSPFGFDYSVTAGIVSALGRSLPGDNYVPFIQTDVAINPGNSGGPLFNMDGKVIGINSQIYSRTGGFMGVSFAIPIDVAMNVVEQLKKDGVVRRGWLGVMIQEVNRELAESFGLDKPHGALVAEVVEDSPADKSGLETGDVIVAFDGKEIIFSSDLPHLVGQARPNTYHPVDIIRDGRKKRVNVKIGMLDDKQAVAVAPSKAPVDNSRLGLAVQELTKAQKDQLEINAGVRISKISNNEASQSGLRVGDVILKLNNKSVKSVKDFERISAKLRKDDYVPLLVLQNGSPKYIALKVK